MAAYVANLKIGLLWVVLQIGLWSSSCHDDADGFVYQAGNTNQMDFGQAKPTRYLLYDVNPGEGFNLRRDVYMRIANLVKQLNEVDMWILVLPPWGRIYHWQSHLNQMHIPWSLFFDVRSLNKHVPVVEFEQFLNVIGDPVIEEVCYLQHYEEGWSDGTWEEKMDERKCIGHTGYEQDQDGHWLGWFFGFHDHVHANSFKCISIQGHAGYMKPFLLHNTTARSLLLDRAETLLHDTYGDVTYWEVRRSMTFSEDLRKIGNDFRAQYLNSTDENDRTILEEWTKMKRKHGDAIGGPYIAVHLRRKDYLHAHAKEVPSLKFAAKQVQKLLKKYDLRLLFVATDAPDKEFQEFKELLKKYEVTRFIPTSEVHQQYKDGGVAIIDQWVCAHARYFIGTHVSTFSYRIQEEREILGFNPETTFNRLCGDKEEKACEQPVKWLIVY